MREEIIFAGFGGQGIMFMGKALSYVAMNAGRFVTWMPSYGAEVRGGTAHSMVVVSDEPVASPVVREPSICVVMNLPSLVKFKDRVKEKGLLVINRSLVKAAVDRKDIDVLEIPATDMAFELGDSRVANMIALGSLIAKKGMFSLDSLADSLKNMIPSHRKELLSINRKAIEKGYEYGSR